MQGQSKKLQLNKQSSCMNKLKKFNFLFELIEKKTHAAINSSFNE